jgi:hypothetical protein
MARVPGVEGEAGEPLSDTGNSASPEDNAPAEALPPGYIVPRTGIGRLRPFQPGQSGNPSGLSNGQVSAYTLARQMCAGATPKAVEKQIELLESQDERIVLMASQAIIERGAGKVRDHSAEEQQTSRVNLDALTADDRKALALLLRKALGG